MEYLTSIWNKFVEHHREMTGFIFVLVMIKYALPIVIYLLNKLHDRSINRRLNEERCDVKSSMEAAGYSQQQIEDFLESIQIPEIKKPSILKFLKRFVKKIRSNKH